MPWVRIDEEFPDHPKVVGAGPLGIALQVAALCYCNRHLTDGFVPRSTARRLIDLDELKVDPDDVIEGLLRVGMWTLADGGYQIHDYEQYQPTKAQVLAERERNREAGRKGGLAKGKRGAKRSASEPPNEALSDREADRLAKTLAKPKPVPVPPVGTGGSEASPGEIPQASPTARKTSATPAIVTPIPTAQTFVAAYVDAYRGRAGHDPPARVKGQVAKHLREALDDGVSTDHVKAGFVEWFEDNKHPATLPSYIEIAGRNGGPRSKPTSRLLAEDAKLARWADTMEGAEHAAERVAPHRGQARRELPRPGPPG